MRDKLVRMGGALLLMVAAAGCGGGGTTSDDQAGDVEPGAQQIDSEIDQSAGVEPPADAASAESNPLFSDAPDTAVDPTPEVDDSLFLGGTAEARPDAGAAGDALFGGGAGG